MNARQKFWLKVALALTAPFWIAPAILLACLWMIVKTVWDVCSELVDSFTSPRA